MRKPTRSAVAVIGAAYGDEGKGLMTDAFAADLGGTDVTVVRFNGGAQAGHTVIAPNGRGHVFHHVGSGSFTGAATYLSRFFVANPIVLHTELADLARLGVQPKITCDPETPITLPHDMMINQIVERARGDARHGSCGLGFGETIERGLNPEFALLASQLGDAAHVRELLQRVAASWVPMRLARLGVTNLSAEDRALLASGTIMTQWLEDIAAFRDAVTIAQPKPMAGRVIFEGAQGLALDQDRGAFPYVTRSNTGVKNILPLARALGVAHLDIVYVTRAYTTRHGAGPLAHELPASPHAGIVDQTNVPNPWQGRLRFGTLDLDLLARSICDDLSDIGTLPFTTAQALAMTCLDQVGTEVEYWQHQRLQVVRPGALAAAAARLIGASGIFKSHGPSRAAIMRRTIEK